MTDIISNNTLPATTNETIHTDVLVLPNEENHTSKRKELPDEIKNHFENNSKSFVDFAKNKENRHMGKIIDENLWDKALLEEEYPDGRKPIEIESKIIEKSTGVPKKPNNVKESTPPTRIETHFTPIAKNTQKEQPLSIQKETLPKTPIELPRYIPKKQIFQQNTDASLKSREVPRMEIPNKPANLIVPKKSSYPPPKNEMSELLRKRLIEGQLKIVFEEAPDVIKTMLEKLTAKEVLSLDRTMDSSSEVWKTRLRDYVLKLNNQGKAIFPLPIIAEPQNNEGVIAYIERIYPAIVKAGITENN